MTDIIEELSRLRNNKNFFLDSLIETLYKKCLVYIKFENNANKTDMIFEVPVMTAGFPLYDQQEVAILLNKYIKSKGFRCMYQKPYRLYIKW